MKLGILEKIIFFHIDDSKGLKNVLGGALPKSGDIKNI
jgi:hypothetical protein